MSNTTTAPIENSAVIDSETKAKNAAILAIVDTVVNDVEVPKMDFGKARFSLEMERIYQALVRRFKLEPDLAAKIARACSSDAGHALSKASAEIKIKAMDKKGLTTIKDTSSIKGIEMTPALQVARALEWMDGAGKNGVSYGHTEWKFTPAINDWIETLK